VAIGLRHSRARAITTNPLQSKRGIKTPSKALQTAFLTTKQANNPSKYCSSSYEINSIYWLSASCLCRAFRFNDALNTATSQFQG
jgi:hypothetical protein